MRFSANRRPHSQLDGAPAPVAAETVPLDRPSFQVRHGRLTPLDAGIKRVLGEVAVVWVLLLLLTRLIDPSFTSTWPGIALQLIANAWAILWPAWRLRRARGRFLSRLLVGLRNTFVTAGALVILTWIITLLLVPTTAQPIRSTVPVSLAGDVALGFAFLLARVAVIVVASIVSIASSRLHWQLTIAHLAVTVLTVVGMTALASFIGLQVLLLAAQSHPQQTAQSLATAIEATGNASVANRARLQTILGAVQDGSVFLPGESSITRIFGNPTLPARLAILDPRGHVVAATVNADYINHAGMTGLAAPLPQDQWRTVQRTLQTGQLVETVQRIKFTLNNQHDVVYAELGVGAAPLVDPHGKRVAVVLAEVADPISLITSTASTAQLFAVVLVVTAVATISLLMVAFLPILTISFVFGYFLARGLTRRIQAVSRVTTAIAAGDLTQRAPVTTRNEIGRLAQDVNHMAASLQTAIGAMQQARSEAEAALRTRQELVASISHELRTPLAILHAHLENLSDHQAEEQRRAGNQEIVVPAATLHALQHETNRLSGLVDDLFDLARAETGAVTVRSERIDVAALVDEVATLMRPLAQREGKITLAVEAPPGLPAAQADGDRLRQILNNLLRNAVRHTPEGGIIVLSVSVAHPWLVVAVADTGEGIPPEHLPHIFDRFYRVDQARTRGLGGAGLGLAIVREFVELMGGRVEVESTPGEGSCFRVYLPLADAPAPPRPDNQIALAS